MLVPMNAMSRTPLGSSLDRKFGALDFDPVGNVFVGNTANTTMGLRQTVKNRNGDMQERTMNIVTDSQGQVIEHLISVGGGNTHVDAMQKQTRYCNGQKGVERHVEERIIGEQAVRQVCETNTVTGDDRQTELLKGVGDVTDFNEKWNQMAVQLAPLNITGLQLPTGLTLAPHMPGYVQSGVQQALPGYDQSRRQDSPASRRQPSPARLAPLPGIQYMPNQEQRQSLPLAAKIIEVIPKEEDAPTQIQPSAVQSPAPSVNTQSFRAAKDFAQIPKPHVVPGAQPWGPSTYKTNQQPQVQKVA